ncbi:MAG: amidohydrolase family protein, partial [Candidatus Latescibacteria bacterium]|nr:amidohydrolase family protein [Candidatus Latescibacterota bacterium]
LDPSVSTWKRELDRALAQDRVQLVRLLPNYHQYDLNDIGDILEALVDAKLGAIVQVCMEDIRRQHPLSQVPNVSVSDVFDVAERFSKLRLIIGGAKAGEIRGAKARLLSLPNLYADVSQVDGLNAIRVLVDEGLEAKLVFGSHAPLFIPYAALGRVVTDLDDEATEAILNGNALRFLSGG